MNKFPFLPSAENKTDRTFPASQSPVTTTIETMIK